MFILNGIFPKYNPVIKSFNFSLFTSSTTHPSIQCCPSLKGCFNVLGILVVCYKKIKFRLFKINYGNNNLPRPIFLLNLMFRSLIYVTSSSSFVTRRLLYLLRDSNLKSNIHILSIKYHKSSQKSLFTNRLNCSFRLLAILLILSWDGLLSGWP